MRIATLGASLAFAAACAPAARAEDGCLWWQNCPTHEAYVTVTGERGFAADLHGDRGTFSLWRAGVGVEGRFPIGLRWSLAPALHLEQDAYRFSDPDAIVAGSGRLLEDATFARLGLFATFRGASGWGFGAGPIVQSAGVPGARFEDTLTYGGGAGVRIPLGGDSSLLLGASIETTLEGSPTYFPLIDLQGSGTGRFHLDYLRSGISTAGIRAAYDVTPKLTVGVLGRSDGRAWRLAEDDRVPGGVFRNARLAAGLDLSWRPSACVTLTATGWLNVQDSIRIDDRRGDDVTDFGADPSPMIGLSVSIRF